MKLLNYFILTTLLHLLFISCNGDKGVQCTEEYRYVTITVNGDVLDDFFTIRNINGDTIRFDKNLFPEENVYVVLSDSFQNMIKNKIESFSFKGFINDTLVVNEPFVIKADECHIEYVSGKSDINL